MKNPLNLLKSEMIRNTSVLITGTVLAQLIYILLQPVVRRLYPVEAFGMYSVYVSLVGMIAVISTLRYDDAIVLPLKDKDSANLVFLSIVLGFLISVVIFLIILIFAQKIPVWINLPSGFPASILYLVPAGAFLLNVYQAFNYWLIRKKRFNSVSANKMIRRGSEGLTQISLAVLKSKSGLIFSDIAGQLANVIAGIIQGFRSGFSLKTISMIKVRYVSRKYSEFPKFNLIPAFMSTYCFLMPPLIINKFFSAEYAGFFDASKTLLSIPLAVVATSISSVLLQKTSERYNMKKSITGDLKPLLVAVLLICLFEILIIMLFGPWLFSIVFGHAYEVSGIISRILVWSFVLNFLIASFSSLFYSMRKIKTYSIWQVFYFIAILTLLFFNRLEFYAFLRLYVLIEVTCYFILIAIMLRTVSKYERSVVNS